MTTLSIKEVPEVWAEALRRRAANNHRSLQGELMAIIEQAARETPGVPPPLSPALASAPFARMPGTQGDPRRQGWKTIEQIAAEHLARHPQPITQGPLAVDLIREDRDAR